MRLDQNALSVAHPESALAGTLSVAMRCHSRSALTCKSVHPELSRDLKADVANPTANPAALGTIGRARFTRRPIEMVGTSRILRNRDDLFPGQQRRRQRRP